MQHLATKANSQARQYKSCEIVIIIWLKSYPYTGKKRGCTVIECIEMSHTKPEPNATKGIRTTVTEQKHRMTFEIKIQHQRQLHMACNLFSDNHANSPNHKWHSLIRKFSAKRKFYRGHCSFQREKDVL